MKIFSIFDSTVLTLILIALAMVIYVTNGNAAQVNKLFSCLTFIYAALCYIEIKEFRTELKKKLR